MGWLHQSLAAITLYQEDYAKSWVLNLKSLEWAEKLGYRQGAASPIMNLGTLAYLENDYPQMEAWFQKSLALGRETGFAIAVVFSLRMLGFAALLQGRVQQAAGYFLESLPLANAIGDSYGERAVLVGMAGVATEMGQPEHAMRLLGATEASFKSFFIPIVRWEQIQVERIEAECRRRMGKAEFEAARESGMQMNLEQALSYAKGTIRP